MAEYEVTITRALTLVTTVSVQASTEDDAEAKALEQVEQTTLWEEESDDCRVERIAEV
jgi:hypothetical protein